jgi:hypothetical protein
MHKFSRINLLFLLTLSNPESLRVSIQETKGRFSLFVEQGSKGDRDMLICNVLHCKMTDFSENTGIRNDGVLIPNLQIKPSIGG